VDMRRLGIHVALAIVGETRRQAPLQLSKPARIVLTPNEGTLRIELQGNLAAMLKAGASPGAAGMVRSRRSDVGKMRGRQTLTTSCR
jgi:hypothetical protein